MAKLEERFDIELFNPGMNTWYEWTRRKTREDGDRAIAMLGEDLRGRARLIRVTREVLQ